MKFFALGLCGLVTKYKTDDSLLLMITKHSVIHCYDKFPLLGAFSYSQIPATFALLCLPASHMIISSRASHILLPEWSPMAGRLQATALLHLAPLWDHSRPAFPLSCQYVPCLTDNVSVFVSTYELFLQELLFSLK